MSGWKGKEGKLTERGIGKEGKEKRTRCVVGGDCEL